MTLYEINQAISGCLTIDTETGEAMFDEERFAELEMLRQDKLENIACWIKNLNADAEALQKEILSLKKRKEDAERTAERLTELLKNELNGERFSTPKVAVSWRRSSQVVADNIEIVPPAFLRIKTITEIDKVAVKDATKRGESIPGVHIEETLNMNIK